jgi:hypothetical protein
MLLKMKFFEIMLSNIARQRKISTSAKGKISTSAEEEKTVTGNAGRVS